MNGWVKWELVTSTPYLNWESETQRGCILLTSKANSQLPKQIFYKEERDLTEEYSYTAENG